MMTLSRPRLESNREPAMCIMCSVSSGCCIQGELADEQEVGKHQDSCEQGQYENMSREEAIQGSLPDCPNEMTCKMPTTKNG